MKLKLLLTFSLLLAFHTFYGQEFSFQLTSVRSIDDQIQEEQYSTDEVPLVDRLVLRVPIKNISRRDKQFYSKKEWRKIKKQIQKNKKRLSMDHQIHSIKALDTIYMDIPKGGESSLSSGW